MANQLKTPTRILPAPKVKGPNLPPKLDDIGEEDVASELKAPLPNALAMKRKITMPRPKTHRPN